MSYVRILAVHTDWLNEKRYNEMSLDSREKRGAFHERLRVAFDKAIDESKWDDKPRTFIVDVQGRFPPKDDMVEFDFKYQYEPVHQKLQLLSVTASMGELVEVFPIQLNTRRQLPDSKKAYEQLVLKTQQQTARKINSLRKEPFEGGSKIHIK